MALTLATAQTTIETALRRVINLGLRRRLPAVADAATLRAAASRGADTSTYARTDDDIVYVTALSACFQWSTTSTAADNGTTVIKPSDAGSAGRWLICTSTSARASGTPIHQVQSGYLQSVRLAEGDLDEDQFLDLAFGQCPAVAIEFVGDEPEPASLIPGALYRWLYHFDILVSSTNLRDRLEGVVGSDVSAEFARDPGVNRLDGLLQQLLAGSTLDDCDGVAYVEIGPGSVAWADLRQRRFARLRRITVRASIHNVANDTDLTAVTEVDATRELGALHDDATLDRDWYVVSGIGVAVASGLTQSVSAGSAYLGGVLVPYAGESHTFGAYTDTYLDLAASGVLHFVAVAVDAPAPNLTAGRLRVGVVTTDSAGIVGSRYVAATAAQYGDIDIINV